MQIEMIGHVCKAAGRRKKVEGGRWEERLKEKRTFRNEGFLVSRIETLRTRRGVYIFILIFLLVFIFIFILCSCCVIVLG